MFSKMGVQLNLIAAACENMGIGKNNSLPWKLRNEMKYFNKMTSQTKNPEKQNVVVMGRKTWESVPPAFRPFRNRINIVLSRQDFDTSGLDNVYHFKSFPEAVDKLQCPNFSKTVENVWVIGGSEIYKESMQSKHFYRLYLTEIQKMFDCDTFFPALGANLKEVQDPEVPTGIQKEGDVEYIFKVYENVNFSTQ